MSSPRVTPWGQVGTALSSSLRSTSSVHCIRLYLVRAAYTAEQTHVHACIMYAGSQGCSCCVIRAGVLPSRDAAGQSLSEASGASCCGCSSTKGSTLCGPHTAAVQPQHSVCLCVGSRAAAGFKELPGMQTVPSLVSCAWRVYRSFQVCRPCLVL